MDDDIVEAKEYVVEVDAQSMLETEIDSVVLSRRESQKEIRDGIEKRRRKQLAKIRGDTLRSRYEAGSREELQKILQHSNEIQVLDEPENPTPGHPYGRVLIRIDENKRKLIIKLLENKSEFKYNCQDYKGAIKAIRRAEKYY